MENNIWVDVIENGGASVGVKPGLRILFARLIGLCLDDCCVESFFVGKRFSSLFLYLRDFSPLHLQVDTRASERYGPSVLPILNCG